MIKPRPQLKPKRKSPSILFTLGGAIILIVGGGLAYWLLRHQSSSRALVRGTALVPESALVSLTMATDRNTWQQLSMFGTEATATPWAEGIQNLGETLLQPQGLDFEAHIQPWAERQMTLAILPPTLATVEDLDTQATIWVVPIRNYNQALTLLNNGTLTQGQTTQTRTYEGVEIREFQSPDGTPAAIALLDQRWAVFTNESASIDQVIDTLRGQPSVAQLPRFQAALGSIQGGSPFAEVYLNLPQASAQVASNPERPVSPEALERLQNVQGLAATLALDNQGLNIRTITWLKPNASETLTPKALSQSMAKYLPQDTLMMSSVGSFQQLWQDYNRNVGTQLLLPFDPRQWRNNLLSSTGINFDETFVEWMDSDFVGALVPSDAGQGAGLVLLAKATDRQAAEQAFQELDTAVRDRFNFQVSESTLGDRTITNWRVPPGLPVASHGWLDNNIAFMTLGSPIAERILTPESSLSQASLFQTATRSELRTNSSTLFIDVPRTLSLMQNSPFLPQLAPSAMPYAETIEAIGVTAAPNNAWSTRYNIRITLKQPS
ncbi:DUF3352 domain-containing protein [Synechococcales cyanobacterium C]|uniref:DUF3352 domain-containing protein n=1 Tax=Petrachloros mirabilis ULC683 TaxID=2781853 RepID=A0A8K2ABT3_9CYAN|nr:DUF3352 domain-containing protein [Petrachloros mirabilis]NCJ05070.1 DUF3352 domain-containing protein [Petrachloros mirabilis ULC683]